MAYAPIALIIPQYEDYPNYWLKAYEQGTTTPLSMATDALAGTTLAKSELDTQGFPTTAASARFIPFIDGDYDLWLFPTEAEADANDTSNAIQFADNLNAFAGGIERSIVVEDKAAAAALVLTSGDAGRKIFITSDDGGEFTVRFNAAPGTYSDNGGAYTGTIFIPSGGDGTIGIVRDYSGAVNAKWFGAVGDDAADDTTALTNFFSFVSSGYNGFLPGGIHKITSRINQAFVDCKITGVPNESIITITNDYTVLDIGASSDLVIEGVNFESTYVNTVSGSGLLRSQNENISNITIYRCYFSASACAAEGVSISPRTSAGETSIASNIVINECIFEDVGGVCSGFLNRGTGSDKYVAFTGLRFTNNTIKNAGGASADGNGFAITMDGFGTGFHVDGNTIDNALKIGIENVGWINGTFDNNIFGDFTQIYTPFSMSGSDAMSGLSISGNIVNGEANAGLSFFEVNDSVFSNNIFVTDSTVSTAVTFRNCNDNLFQNEKYVAVSTTSMRMEAAGGDSNKNNVFNHSIFDTSADASQNNCVHFFGALNSGNVLNHCVFDKGGGGQYYEEFGSASGNLAISPIYPDNSEVLGDYISHNIASDADYTLLIYQYSANVIRITDTGVVLTATRKIILPDIAKQYTVINDTAQALSFETSVGGGGVSVAAGMTAIVAHRDTVIIRVTADV